MVAKTIRAIDVGYGNVKFTLARGDKGVSCSLFPSLAPNATLGPDLSAGVGQRRSTVVVEVGKTLYEVGKDAELAQDASYGRYLDPDYASSDVYLALLRGALFYMGVETIDMLVLGLPINTFERNKAVLRDRAIGDHVIPNPLAGRPGEKDTITVKVKDCYVMPQPMGAFFDYAISNNLYGRMKDQTNLVIDPGFFTLDWLVSVGQKPINARTGAHPGGMSAVLGTIAENVGRKLGTQITDVSSIDRALRTGTLPRFNGKEFDLAPYLPAAQAKVRQFISVLANKVGNAIDIDNILLAGGGASFFQEAIQEKFPNHEIMLVNEPVFANVRGFHLAGEQYMQALEFQGKRVATA